MSTLTENITNLSIASYAPQVERWFQEDTPPDMHIIMRIIDALDAGVLRIATPCSNAVRSDKLPPWNVHSWLCKAVLLFFKHTPSKAKSGSFDKVPLKTVEWDSADFMDAGFRLVPGAIVRKGAFLGKSVIVMPSFVNIGAYVGEGTMIDTGARVGSCAQIGKNCHLSGGVGIGGVLEPPGAQPVIIEDNCFIGAQSEVAEGVHVGPGCVLGMGTLISKSTKIVDRETGEIYKGTIPPYSVVVPGTYRDSKKIKASFEVTPQCAIIIKTVDASTRAKTALNDLLRAP